MPLQDLAAVLSELKSFPSKFTQSPLDLSYDLLLPCDHINIPYSSVQDLSLPFNHLTAFQVASKSWIQKCVQSTKQPLAVSKECSVTANNVDVEHRRPNRKHKFCPLIFGGSCQSWKISPINILLYDLILHKNKHIQQRFRSQSQPPLKGNYRLYDYTSIMGLRVFSTSISANNTVSIYFAWFRNFLFFIF